MRRSHVGLRAAFDDWRRDEIVPQRASLVSERLSNAIWDQFINIIMQSIRRGNDYVNILKPFSTCLLIRSNKNAFLGVFETFAKK